MQRYTKYFTTTLGTGVSSHPQKRERCQGDNDSPSITPKRHQRGGRSGMHKLHTAARVHPHTHTHVSYLEQNGVVVVDALVDVEYPVQRELREV